MTQVARVGIERPTLRSLANLLYHLSHGRPQVHYIKDIYFSHWTNFNQLAWYEPSQCSQWSIQLSVIGRQIYFQWNCLLHITQAVSEHISKHIHRYKYICDRSISADEIGQPIYRSGSRQDNRYCRQKGLSWKIIVSFERPTCVIYLMLMLKCHYSQC